MKILHVLRKKDERVLNIIKDMGEDNIILFIHDAVYYDDPNGLYCKKDVEARGLNRKNVIDYDGIVKLIFEANKVINW
jgi:hypothetical protein